MALVTVDFVWEGAGAVELDARGALVFPPTPPLPALYRFDFAGSGEPAVYIGETVNLDRRLQFYRTPGNTQYTNLRLNLRMRTHVSAGGHVMLSLVTAGTLTIAGEARPLNLASRAERCLAETAALVEASQASAAVIENL